MANNSYIYRKYLMQGDCMAETGRLLAVRIGKQWCFLWEGQIMPLAMAKRAYKEKDVTHSTVYHT